MVSLITKPTDRLGFQYWKHPGAIAEYLETGSLGRFLAILSVLVQAAFSYQGVELVAIAASETKNPRANIKKAVGRVFYRILFFYVVGVLITGMIVPYNDPNLLQSTGNAAESPYVIAMKNAGIRGLPHVINAAVFTSAFSAGNSFLYTASRILYGLALRGQAPKIFAYTTKKGLPLTAVLASGLFPWLAFLTVSSGASTVFNWFVNLSTVGGFFAWLGISAYFLFICLFWDINPISPSLSLTLDATYIGFYRGLKAQGISRDNFTYKSAVQPYAAIWGTFWLVILIVINGFSVFWDFNASGFLTAYINVPLVVILFFGFKFIKKTHWWRPHEMDFVTGIPTVEETEFPVEPPTTFLAKVADKLF